MPVVFIEAPPGIRPDSKKSLVKKINAARRNAGVCAERASLDPVDATRRNHMSARPRMPADRRCSPFRYGVTRAWRPLA
jgi:hypothetical protein